MDAGDRLELLEQLRSLPFSGKKLIPLMIPVHWREGAPVYGDGAECAGLAVCGRITEYRSRLLEILQTVVAGDTYNVGGECENAEHRGRKGYLRPPSVTNWLR